MAVTVTKVANQADLDAFLRIPYHLYANDLHYVFLCSVNRRSFSTPTTIRFSATPRRRFGRPSAMAATSAALPLASTAITTIITRPVANCTSN